jgi:Xaa-Pro aminopeptidase
MTEHAGNRQEDGRERIARVQETLKANQLDAIIATLPSNVLMLSGYWPVIGTAVAIATKDGEVAILAPQDEVRFAEQSWAHRVLTYHPTNLETPSTPAVAVSVPLRSLLRQLQLQCARLGYEFGAASEPATYAGMYLYSYAIVESLRFAAPAAPLVPAGELLARLSATKTVSEVSRIRIACHVARQAYQDARPHLHAGETETEVASWYRSGFSIHGMAIPDVLRADGFAWCMSGPNSAEAKAAFAYSRNRKLQNGELVLVHSNSYVDGYWTDITRTQVIGELDKKQEQILHAIGEARSAAFDTIRPGVRAAHVDQAARQVLARNGFEKEFPHSTGHGVGFAAISANARPRIHPSSDEILESGMTFNIEPAVYLDGYGGARHCDMVAVTNSGMELLTDF